MDPRLRLTLLAQSAATLHPSPSASGLTASRRFSRRARRADLEGRAAARRPSSLTLRRTSSPSRAAVAAARFPWAGGRASQVVTVATAQITMFPITEGAAVALSGGRAGSVIARRAWLQWRAPGATAAAAGETLRSSALGGGWASVLAVRASSFKTSVVLAAAAAAAILVAVAAGVAQATRQFINRPAAAAAPRM